ncbi:hypothetical protein AB2B38_008525 [Balneola sp. MJW-20]|uniref:hypothetical protein n=1 Tax=Gracilimonas aurantiaca TaxID=3234185 RepID=UPI0034650189
MKKLTIEKIILAVLGVTIAYFAFSHIPNPYAMANYLAGYVWMCGIFIFLGLIWIGEPEKKKSKGFYWSVFAGLILGGWVVVNFFYVLYWHNKSGNPLILWHIFHPLYMDNYLEKIAAALILGPVYGYFRKMIRKGEIARFRKALGWSFGTLTSAVLIFMGVYWFDLSFEGDQSIQFLDKDQQFTSLEEVLAQPELQGKKIYTDLWFSTCGPCISAFKNKDAGKELLSQNDYVFLYLGRETAGPLSKQDWINTIKKYDLQGYHVYMSEELELEMQQEVSKRIDRYYGFPHYLMIGENGEVSNWDAPEVTDLEGLKKSI